MKKIGSYSSQDSSQSDLLNSLPQQITGNAVDDPAHFRAHLPHPVFDKLFDFYAIARFHFTGLGLLDHLAAALSNKNLRLAHTNCHSNTSSLILAKCIPTTQSQADNVEAHTDPGTLLILFNPPPSLHLFRPANPQKPNSKPNYIAAKGMDDIDEWHSVAYRLGPDEKATLVDFERVRWPAGDWHAARMGVEGDETL